MSVTEVAPNPPEAAEAAVAAPAPEAPRGIMAGADHKAVGTAHLVVAVVFLAVGTGLALAMRAQLSTPDASVVGARTYRQLFTLHGIVSVFLFLVPAWLGLATALVPLQIGAARLAFPRLSALSLWLIVAGGGMIVASPFVSGPRLLSGWSLAAPVPEGRGAAAHAGDLVVLGLMLVAVAVILGAANLLVTIARLRARGMTPRRAPLFTWSVLVSSAVLLLAMPVLLGGLVLLFVDRHYGGHAFRGFTGSAGGNPLLWPRLFWFAAYPLLWALLLPALGVVCDIVAVFSRRPLVGRRMAAAAMVAVGALAFAGWGSEVRGVTGRSRPLFALAALAVLAPVAAVALTWLGTEALARKNRRLARAVPVVHANGLLTVLAVGLAAAAVAALAVGRPLHRTYWVVGMQHALFFLAPLFGIVAALHYWAPKLWGRHLSERLGMLEFLLLLGGAHLTVLPMLVLGLQGMHVHVTRYGADRGWGPANLVSSAGTALTTLAVLVVVLDVLTSVVARRGRSAADDPWEGHTLEWATSSPPPPHNFDSLPEIRSESPLLDRRTANAESSPEQAQAAAEGAS